MAFDFKKEYREFYLPKDRPEVVTVPTMHYMAVRGEGDPNQPGGTYQQAIQMLYTVAYTLKMSGRAVTRSTAFSTMWCRRWRASGGRALIRRTRRRSDGHR